MTTKKNDYTKFIEPKFQIFIENGISRIAILVNEFEYKEYLKKEKNN